jgi:hypothetical protein
MLGQHGRSVSVREEAGVVNEMDPATFTPSDSPLTIADVMSSPVYRDLATPKLSEGDVAFDFALRRLDTPGEALRLSSFARRQPVALIFGSYT